MSSYVESHTTAEYIHREKYDEAVAELTALRARVAELEAERDQYAAGMSLLEQTLHALDEKYRRLLKIASELADDAEADIKAQYCNADGSVVHPAYQRKFNRDMAIVREARAAIGRKE